jgi:hypothetical protein
MSVRDILTESADALKPIQRENATLSFCFYVLYTLNMTGILYCTRNIFTQNPGINVFQVTALKATISFIFVLVT